MSRKLLNEVDGFVVDEYQATFTGAFDVGGADAKYMAYDDEVLIVVKARVKMPRLKEMKNGDIVRVNVLGVKEAGVVRSDELKKHLCETLGLETPSPQLTLDEALSPNDDNLQPLELTPAEEPEDETPVEVFSPASLIKDPVPGPSVKKYEDPGRIPGTKDSRLAAFLSEP